MADVIVVLGPDVIHKVILCMLAPAPFFWPKSTFLAAQTHKNIKHVNIPAAPPTEESRVCDDLIWLMEQHARSKRRFYYALQFALEIATRHFLWNWSYLLLRESFVDFSYLIESLVFWTAFLVRLQLNSHILILNLTLAKTILATIIIEIPWFCDYGKF